MIPLSQIPVNQPVRLFSICLDDQQAVEQLMQMGLYTGARLCIHQKYPTYVLVSDEATLAIEDELADKIMVELA